MDEQEDRRLQQRIRERAHELWVELGQPQGQEDVLVEKAAELVAIEENQDTATKPAPRRPEDDSVTTQPVEPIEALENTGEYPTTTDQGEMQIPHREGLGEKR